MDAQQLPNQAKQESSEQNRVDYWKANLNLTLTLLAIWFIAGYVLSIIFAPLLNNITFLGGPLGFWIAQNGAIYVFVLLILVYCIRMNSLDEEFNVDE